MNIPMTPASAPAQFSQPQMPAPKKGKKKLMLIIVLLLLIGGGVVVFQKMSMSAPYKPNTVYQPNPTNFTTEQVSKAFQIVIASSTLSFDTAGTKLKPVTLSDLPAEISKFLKGINSEATYNAVLFNNGIYSIVYKTNVSLSENHSNAILNIDRENDEEKLLQSRLATLASMAEIEVSTYQIRITQKVAEGGLTEVTLTAKPK